MKTILTLLIVLLVNSASRAQTNRQTEPETKPPVSQQQIAELPLAKRNFRPKTTLQRALQLAESYAAREKIDLSGFYLFQAKYILYGDKDNQKPCWFFWWVNESGALGNYVEIIVSIDSGNVSRLPSM